MVAGQDASTKNAYNLATTQGQGIGAYAPYLRKQELTKQVQELLQANLLT